MRRCWGAACALLATLATPALAQATPVPAQATPVPAQATPVPTQATPAITQTTPPPTQAPPTATAPYAAVQNFVVTYVHMEAPATADLAELRALVEIQPGYLLDPADVRAALVRLYALGRFSQVAVRAHLEGGALSRTLGLHFVLTPLRRLEGLTVLGLQHVSAEGLQQALGVRPGDEVDLRTAATLEGRAYAHLQRIGYPQAQVAVSRQDHEASGAASFTVTVAEGPPRCIATLSFVGSPKLSSPLLRELLRSRPGQPLNMEDLQADAQSLADTYRDHGFLNVQVGAARVLRSLRPPSAQGGRVSAPTGWYDVQFPVVAGRRYAFDFVGNHLFDDSTLRQLVNLEGALPLRSVLQLLRQSLLALYRRHGYPSAKVSQVQVLEAGGVVRLVSRIEEGLALQIDAIHISGNRALPTELLVQQVRALLQRELGQTEAFTALLPFDRQLRTSQVYRPPTPAPSLTVPPEQRYVAELYAAAVAQIQAAYRDAGYLEVRIKAPQLHLQAPSPVPGTTTERHHGSVTLVIEEGPQTFVSALAFAGNTALESAELLQTVQEATADRPLSAPLSPGAPLSHNGVEDGRIEILRRYRNQGFLYARVAAEVTALADPHWATVRYTLEEGPQVRLGRVLIRGNQRTRQSIVRSRLSLHAGDLYRLEQAVTDQREISALGVFNAVRVKLVDEEHPAERKDLVAEVSERPRQPIDVVPGLSTANGPRLRASYSHLNVWGTASTFTASLKVNRQVFFGLYGDFADELQARYRSYHGMQQLTRALERETRLGLRSPPIRALPLDPVFRADLVDQRVNAVRYSLDREAFILGADLRLPGHFKASLEGNIGVVNLECDENIDPNCNLTPEVRRLQSRPIDVGHLWILKGGPLLVWDRRDNPLNPSRGLFASLRYTQAMGGASPSPNLPFEPFVFSKYEVNVTGYVPLGPRGGAPGGAPILALAARGGSINLLHSQVPIDERFFLGGRDTLRGFVESTLIPQDACVGPGPRSPGCAEQILATDSGPPLSRGGNTYVLFKTELRFGITDSVSLGVFADLGNLWIYVERTPHLTLRLGTGLGMRYATPVGAIAIDFGINPSPRQAFGEANTQLHFSIGAF
jgi:outer membrane protein insertion porin family